MNPANVGRRRTTGCLNHRGSCPVRRSPPLARVGAGSNHWSELESERFLRLAGLLELSTVTGTVPRSLTASSQEAGLRGTSPKLKSLQAIAVGETSKRAAHASASRSVSH